MENLSYIPDWVKEGIFYHIYPYGFFGAPKFNSKNMEIINRLEILRNFYPHFKELGVNIIQFGPIFQSISHGYDTTDYFTIDDRLGTNKLFKEIVDELHSHSIKVVLDGVFNHVGREFRSFKDVQKYRENSLKKDWHFIDFNANNPYNDGFDYKNWEGHYELVKLNLSNPTVKDYIFSICKYWLGKIGIDGWRLDVAYQISTDFWREFRQICKKINPDCFLIGEMIHGPYSKWVGPNLLDAGTGYQVYKSIWSAFNSTNLYELKAVLEQSFNPQWGLSKNICLINFLGNHDVTRIKSQLKDKSHLYPAILFLFTSNGVPKLYYGDEIGLEGVKTPHSDDAVRQSMPMNIEDWPEEGRQIFNHVKLCIEIRKKHHALKYGIMEPLFADGETLAFIRRSSQEILIIIISSSSQTSRCKIPLWNQNLNDKIFQEQLTQGGQRDYKVQNNQLLIEELYPNWCRILKQV